MSLIWTTATAAIIVETAITDCDRYYPAFQYVIWGERTAAEAVAVAMVNTIGEA